MPIRIAEGVPIVNSLSILDVLLIVLAFSLFLDLSYRPVDLGYRQVFWILTIPFLIALASLFWSQDRATTIRSILIYVEGLAVYLFVVRELNGLPADRIVKYMSRYVYLLLIPAFLLLLHVPGFEPRLPPDVSRTSGDYLTYFTRLSHPVLGGSNNLASLLVLFAPVLVYWGQTRRRPWATIAGAVAFLAVFLTLSRGTLLSLVLAGCVCGGFALSNPVRSASRGAGRRIWRRVVGIAALGIIAIALFDAVNPTTHELFKDRLTLRNVHARSELISDAWTKIENRPVLGYGSGVAPDGDLALKEGVHNAFLQQVIYYGLPLGLAVSVVLCGLAAFFFVQRRAIPVSGAIAFALIAELISFLFESTFEGTVLRVLIYMAVGMMVALVRAQEGASPRAPVFE